MRTLFLAFCLGTAVWARAAERLGLYDWAEIAKSGGTLPGALVTENGRSALSVRNTNETQLQMRLLTIAKPPVTSSYYALRGELKHAAVRGDGFLEMWSVFPPKLAGGPEMRFFSRTLGESGEMGKITGTSGWRRFVLPFESSGAASAPSALEVNLILPGQGEVQLGALELVEYPGGAAAIGGIGGAANAWWSDRAGGAIGGLAGGLFGCLAGLASWLASKGRARNFVLGSSWACIGTGALLAILGLAAAIMRQPYGVWFPLLLAGILIVSILPGRLRVFQRLYDERELRRMEAADAV